MYFTVYPSEMSIPVRNPATRNPSHFFLRWDLAKLETVSTFLAELVLAGVFLGELMAAGLTGAAFSSKRGCCTGAAGDGLAAAGRGVLG